jgi:fatty acid desaturase
MRQGFLSRACEPVPGRSLPFRNVQKPILLVHRSRSDIPATRCGEESTMLWTILVILVVLWALGLLASVGGAAIHLLLVLALIVLVAQFLSGRRSVY